MLQDFCDFFAPYCIINNATMSDEEEVASYGPPRSLFLYCSLCTSMHRILQSFFRIAQLNGQGLPHANAWEYLNRQTQFYSNDDTNATQLQQQSPSCASYLFAFFTFCLSNSIIFPGSKETRLVSNTFFFKFPILVDNSLDTTSGFPFWPEIRWFLFVKSFGTVLHPHKAISMNHFRQKCEQMI